jgi:hypothetical protein
MCLSQKKGMILYLKKYFTLKSHLKSDVHAVYPTQQMKKMPQTSSLVPVSFISSRYDKNGKAKESSRHHCC